MLTIRILLVVLGGAVSAPLLLGKIDVAGHDSRVVLMSPGSSLRIGDIITLAPRAVVEDSDFLLSSQRSPVLSSVVSNSQQIIALTEDIYKAPYSTRGPTLDVNNSEAIIRLYSYLGGDGKLAINNSNAVLYFSQIGSDLSRQSSSVIAQRVMIGSVLSQNNSNVVNLKSVKGSELSRGNSNVIVNINNIFVSVTGTLVQDVRFNSNALVYCCKNASNSILKLADDVRNTSDAIISFISSDLSVQNSNAIVLLRKDISTVDALATNITITSAQTNLNFDLFISPQNLLIFPFTIPFFRTINGNGHSIHFTRNHSNILQLGLSTSVLFKNVVLKDYSDKVIQPASGSQIIFGEGTVVELAECDKLRYDWTFQGSSTLNGCGNQLSLGNNSIKAQQRSRVMLHNICLTDVHDNNIRSLGDDTFISLKSSQLVLSNNFSYTIGGLEFAKNVVITGTHDFCYQSRITSTIASNAILMIDEGTGFCYQPSINNRDLLYFQDDSATFFLNGSILKLTTTGLRLTRGRVCIDGQVLVESLPPAQVALSEFLGFGNGNVLDDVIIDVKPCASLKIGTGIGVDYENVA